MLGKDDEIIDTLPVESVSHWQISMRAAVFHHPDMNPEMAPRNN